MRKTLGFIIAMGLLIACFGCVVAPAPYYPHYSSPYYYDYDNYYYPQGYVHSYLYFRVGDGGRHWR